MGRRGQTAPGLCVHRFSLAPVTSKPSGAPSGRVTSKNGRETVCACNPRGPWTTSHLRASWDTCAESAEAPTSLQRPGPRTYGETGKSGCGTVCNRVLVCHRHCNEQVGNAAEMIKEPVPVHGPLEGVQADPGSLVQLSIIRFREEPPKLASSPG